VLAKLATSKVYEDIDGRRNGGAMQKPVAVLFDFEF
jgi:hypothetical protein